MAALYIAAQKQKQIVDDLFIHSSSSSRFTDRQTPGAYHRYTYHMNMHIIHTSLIHMIPGTCMRAYYYNISQIITLAVLHMYVPSIIPKKTKIKMCPVIDLPPTLTIDTTTNSIIISTINRSAAVL